MDTMSFYINTAKQRITSKGSHFILLFFQANA